MQRARGFSLIEILVALTMSVVVIGVTMSVLQRTFRATSRERARSSLAREAQFIHLALQRTLVAMGTGVPRGSRIHTTDNTEIDTSVLIAAPKAVGILGDLPRPHAQYNTFGWLHTEEGGDRRHIAWHTENNGACVPGADIVPVAGGGCDAEDFSTFFPGDGGGKCDSNGEEDSRLCAWGVRRLEPNDHFLITAGNGAWTWAEFDYAGIDLVNGTAFIELTSPYSDTANDWPNDDGNAGTNLTMPASGGGAGFVTTLDRIFFEISGTDLLRTQCWGDPDINDANWPPLADTGSLPSGLTLTAASNFDGTNHECTPAEALSHHVVDGASTFTFFDDQNVATTNKDEVRRVDYYILLQSEPTGFGDIVQYPVVGSVGFRNIGMATTTTAPGTGTDTGGTPPTDGGGPPPPSDD